MTGWTACVSVLAVPLLMGRGSQISLVVLLRVFDAGLD